MKTLRAKRLACFIDGRRTHERHDSRLARLSFSDGVFAHSLFMGERGLSGKDQGLLQFADTLNSLWTIAGDAGFYKKHGLDADVVHIGSSPTTISAIVAQDVQVGNAAGSGIANAAVRGADVVSAGCVVNVLAYELVVLESIKSAET